MFCLGYDLIKIQKTFYESLGLSVFCLTEINWLDLHFYSRIKTVLKRIGFLIHMKYECPC